MTKYITKFTILTLLACFTAIASKAQVGYDYSQYDLGASVGFNSFFGDVQSPKSTKSLNFNFDYNQTPFVNYIAELQVGTLAGGDSTKDLLGRVFSADYTYVAFRIQVQAGEVIDYSRSAIANAFKNFYLGAGIGMIYSNITSINRYSIQLPGFYTPGKMSANELFIPARVGYEFKIYNKFGRPDFKIDVGYQTNFIFGDDLDGFKAGAHNDIYSQLTFGVKFAIGGITSYRKQITF